VAALLLLCAAVVPSATLAAPVPAGAADAAQREATRMYQAFIARDLKTFAGFTYPRIVEMAGGRDKMITLVEKGLTHMKDTGLAFKNVVVARPTQIVFDGKETQAILPMKVVMSAPTGEIHTESHLLGVSSDGGKSWTFIDGAKLTNESARKILPSFNPELSLPTTPQPKFVPTKK
jgi:hypothetical protein